MNNPILIDSVAKFFIKTLNINDCYRKLHVYVVAQALIDLNSNEPAYVKDAYSYLFKSDLKNAEMAGIDREWLRKIAFKFYVHCKNKRRWCK